MATASLEVLDRKYFMVYDDKGNKDRRIKKEEIKALEGAGWIAAVTNPTGQRLDSWEITEVGGVVYGTSSLS